MKLKINKSAIFVLKKLASNNIEAISIASLSFNECEVEVSKSDAKKVTKLFRIKTKKRPKKHLYITAAIFFIIFAIFQLLTSTLVFRVVVNTNNKSLKKQALSLVPNGIFAKSKISKSNLEQALIADERISLASVNFVGNTLVINIKEAEEVKFNNKKDIIATCEGIVESINTVSGTAVVKRGDYVMPGDVLIAAKIIVGSEIRDALAIGQVGILSYVQRKEIYAENREEVRRTGKVITANRFAFFKHVDIIKKSKIPYKYYQVTTTKSKIAIGGFLPIKKTKFKIYELSHMSIYEPFEDNQTRILGTVLERAKQDAGEQRAFYSQNVVHKELMPGIFEIVATVQFLIYES